VNALTRVHRATVLVKLDCRDRTHAVLKAITQRLL